MAPWSSLPGAASWACAAAQKLMATLPSSNDLIDFNGIPFRLLVSFEGLPRDDPVSTCAGDRVRTIGSLRSEEHTSELQSLMRISYAVFCLKKKKITLI